MQHYFGWINGKTMAEEYAKPLRGIFRFLHRLVKEMFEKRISRIKAYNFWDK